MLFIKATDFQNANDALRQSDGLCCPPHSSLFWPAVLRSLRRWLFLICGRRRHSPLTYEQCEAVKENASRLACYDRVIGQKSLHPAKEVRRPAKF